jgi:proline dehydrogenase
MNTISPEKNTVLSFDDTATAFAYKTTEDLKDARLLFSAMQYAGLVSIGVRLTPWAINSGLPVKGIIRKTIFKQFVGGETMQETAPVAQKLGEYGVQVILDYGVEGKEGEEAFNAAGEQFIKVIKYAATQPNIPFMSVKVTGIARFALMEKVDAGMRTGEASGLLARYNLALQRLSTNELREWNNVYDRLQRICNTAAAAGVGVLIDAEDSWIQDSVDAMTTIMMETYNKTKPVVYNTLQLYRHDRLQFLKESFEEAQRGNYILGAKLVRGAYMEKERDRAAEKGYPSPIQPTKEATDRDYDGAVAFCVEHLDRIGLIVASHNEQSNLLTTQLLQQKGLPLDHPHVHFSQLFGMSDNITFNLAAAGCSVSKYLPFGPIKDVIPYLMRRAQENTSVKGQTGRELGLIKRELERRGGR